MAPGVGYRNPLRSVGLNTEMVFPSRAPIAQVYRVGLGGGAWGAKALRVPLADLLTKSTTAATFSRIMPMLTGYARFDHSRYTS